MRGLHRRLVELGVRIVENAPLAGVRIDQDRITHITAGEERLSADAYVLAAGPWTGPLSTLIGVPSPSAPARATASTFLRTGYAVRPTCRTPRSP